LDPPNNKNSLQEILQDDVLKLGLDADHSLPSRTEVKNQWEPYLSPPGIFMVCSGTAFVFNVLKSLRKSYRNLENCE
jgi:hypothetical protein